MKAVEVAEFGRLSLVAGKPPKFLQSIALIRVHPLHPWSISRNLPLATGRRGLCCSFMADSIWCNGRLMPEDGLRVSPFDRGLTLGLGLFETMLAVNGRAVLLDRHLARHGAGAQRLGWEMPDRIALEQGIRELLEANRLTRGAARIRLFQTAGKGPLGDPSLGPDCLTILTATALSPSPDRLSLTLSPWVRNERSPLAGLKCASYAENVLALQQARATGFDEPLFLNTVGEVCEAATANVFTVRNGVLLTPPLSSGCLPGVMRDLVLELAERHQIPIEVTPLSLEKLKSCDELFLTSSLRGIAPVTRFLEHEFSPGSVTARIRGLLSGWPECPADPK